jgi:hypothetical protein
VSPTLTLIPTTSTTTFRIDTTNFRIAVTIYIDITVFRIDWYIILRININFRIGIFSITVFRIDFPTLELVSPTFPRLPTHFHETTLELVSIILDGDTKDTNSKVDINSQNDVPVNSKDGDINVDGDSNSKVGSINSKGGSGSCRYQC